ncbi:carbohydrate ABC transporter permease [Plantibacter sp. T3]|uniref:carbohydrate ABC transporter permease n=1 Tax=Plantibacter sp. T3 TaxID=2653161 RepID=UPI0012F1ABA8|nr:carbohydrate ABC transporter permease [Plantibacter sp. T3]VXB62674.1 putative ABC transporter permease protein YurM [Plantibacter sp. T3]
MTTTTSAPVPPIVTPPSSSVPPGPTSRQRVRRRRPVSWISNLVLILISLMILVPVLWVVMASVKTKGEFYGNPWALPEGLHWQNFADAFVDANMGPYLLNSLLVTVVGLCFVLIIAVPAAYALARFEFRGKSILETLLLAGLFINVNYIVIPIFLMLLGWDKALRTFMPSGFFIDNLFVLGLVYAATSLPFTIYLLLAYFRTIPVSYEEAATLDGASRFRTMRTVMLPMAMPAISTAILFNFLSYWNDYIISLSLIPGENKTLQVGLLNLFQAQRAAADYGRLYAGMVIVIIPVVILYIIIQKRLLQNVGAGGLKE